MTYTIDNDMDILSAKTLKEANKKANWLKRSAPLRMVYISKVINTSNGEVTEVVAEV